MAGRCWRCRFVLARLEVSREIVPERFGIADFFLIKLGTVPAVFRAHGLVVSFGKISCAAVLDEVGEQGFRVVDLPPVILRTVPAICLAERLSQLQANSKV